MSKSAVIDLEFCNIPYRKRKGKLTREIIQIGVVVMNEDYQIIETYDRKVSPQYGFIDKDINRLTGISKKDVCRALPIKEALQELVAWLPEDVTIVSWSDNDERQIRRELETKNIYIDGIDAIFENWVDCQKTFGEKMHTQRCYKLSEALVAADIEFKDGAHDGLVDAYNTALLFAKMEREPELVLNPYYQRAVSGEESSCGYSIGNLFSGLDLAIA